MTLADLFIIDPTEGAKFLLEYLACDVDFMVLHGSVLFMATIRSRM